MTLQRFGKEVMELVGSMSLEEKIGQIVMVGIDGPELTPSDEAFISTYHVGNLVFFARNIVTLGQTQALIRRLQEIASQRPHPVGCLLAVDQEGGVVARLTRGATVFPGNMALGATGSEECASRAAEIMAAEMTVLGFNMNLAPVLDVNNNPANPGIGVRSFGEDVSLVTRLGVAMIRAYQRSGVVATAKHFPGKGDITVDSHLDLPTVAHSRERLEEVELVPFRAAIRAGVEVIMTAHVFFPAVEPEPGIPATLSRSVLTGLLRDELGFEGVVLTDDLFMGAISKRFSPGEAAIRALESGADMVLLCHYQVEQGKAIEAVREAVRQGRLSVERVDEAVGRVLALKARYGLLDPERYLGSRDLDLVGNVGTQENRRAALEIARQSVTLLANDEGLIPLVPEKCGNLLVMSPDICRLTQVEDEQLAGSPLLGAISRFVPGVRHFLFSLSPAPDEVAEAVRLARSGDADVIVMGCFNAHLNDQQAALVNAVLDTGVPTIVVAMRNPYDIEKFTSAKTYIATYSFRECAMQAAAEVIFGVTKPRGRLPVTIPGKYVRGSGLTW